jgi:hypothetical protein
MTLVPPLVSGLTVSEDQGPAPGGRSQGGEIKCLILPKRCLLNQRKRENKSLVKNKTEYLRMIFIDLNPFFHFDILMYLFSSPEADVKKKCLDGWECRVHSAQTQEMKGKGYEFPSF